jgi:hypothetical protein
MRWGQALPGEQHSGEHAEQERGRTLIASMASISAR